MTASTVISKIVYCPLPGEQRATASVSSVRFSPLATLLLSAMSDDKGQAENVQDLSGFVRRFLARFRDERLLFLSRRFRASFNKWYPLLHYQTLCIGVDSFSKTNSKRCRTKSSEEISFS